MVNFLRLVGFLEGASYILLLFLAMPLKYWAGEEKYVKLLGMPHGLLFITYILLVYLLKNNQNWSNKTLAVLLTASIIPFGTFYVDWKYFKSLI
tara:strand:- start:145 stop:426 length:282 start_codon:yes stop_codon:yes gene_type:complete